MEGIKTSEGKEIQTGKREDLVTMFILLDSLKNLEYFDKGCQKSMATFNIGNLQYLNT